MAEPRGKVSISMGNGYAPATVPHDRAALRFALEGCGPGEPVRKRISRIFKMAIEKIKIGIAGKKDSIWVAQQGRFFVTQSLNLLRDFFMIHDIVYPNLNLKS